MFQGSIERITPQTAGRLGNLSERITPQTAGRLGNLSVLALFYSCPSLKSGLATPI